MQQINFDLGSSLLINPATGLAFPATTNIPAATYPSGDLSNQFRRGGTLYINVTAATGTLTVTIQGKDILSGVYYPLIASVALGVGFSTLTYAPGYTAVANVAAPGLLPASWRISAVVAGGTVQATVGGTLIL